MRYVENSLSRKKNRQQLQSTLLIHTQVPQAMFIQTYKRNEAKDLTIKGRINCSKSIWACSQRCKSSQAWHRMGGPFRVVRNQGWNSLWNLTAGTQTDWEVWFRSCFPFWPWWFFVKFNFCEICDWCFRFWSKNTPPWGEIVKRFACNLAFSTSWAFREDLRHFEAQIHHNLFGFYGPTTWDPNDAHWKT